MHTVEQEQYRGKISVEERITKGKKSRGTLCLRPKAVGVDKKTKHEEDF